LGRGKLKIFVKNLVTSNVRSIKKKERIEDINVKEEENGETESAASAANGENNGSQDGFPSAGTCDRKDDRDVASSIQL